RFSLGGASSSFSFDAHLKPNEYGRPDNNLNINQVSVRIVTIGLPNQQTNFISGGLDTPITIAQILLLGPKPYLTG
ncbi:hypothetical protein KI387_025288, partial [Taxus chinensis]